MSDLATLLTSAAGGSFPAPDGGWSRIPTWRPGLEAVVAFTGHAFLALDASVPDEVLRMLEADGCSCWPKPPSSGLGGAHDPRVVTALAGPAGWIDTLDLVLAVSVGDGEPHSGLVERADLANHPRVAFAKRVRDDVRAYGYPGESRSVVSVGSGLGGLTELGIETDGTVDGVAMLRDALRTRPVGQTVVACVSPGNARAVRTLWRAGFLPVAVSSCSPAFQGHAHVEPSPRVPRCAETVAAAGAGAPDGPA